MADGSTAHPGHFGHDVLHVLPGFHTEVTVVPFLHGAKEELREVPIEDRQCAFQDEVVSRCVGTYTGCFTRVVLPVLIYIFMLAVRSFHNFACKLK